MRRLQALSEEDLKSVAEFKEGDLPETELEWEGKGKQRKSKKEKKEKKRRKKEAAAASAPQTKLVLKGRR
jgi:hypothetical protein